MNRLVFAVLLAVVVLSPLPLGSNREWSWTLLAFVAGILALAAAAAGAVATAGPAQAGRQRPGDASLWVFPALLFFAVCGWAVVQAAARAPAAWHHPLWSLAGEPLAADGLGSISLAVEDTRVALMRLLAYAAVFAVAYRQGQDRGRAAQAFAWITAAGFIYAVFSLYSYWGGYQPAWLFGEQVLAHDVRGTFINRNHYATWQGLTLLVAIGWFHQRVARPALQPYYVPRDREGRAEEFILQAWIPLTALLLMTAALVLTHSRGGFLASLLGTVLLLYLLDRRAARRRIASRLMVLAAIGAASIAFYLTSEVLLDRINRTDLTAEERLAVFADVQRGIADNPALGYGYGTFASSFRLYDRNETAVQYDRAHNTWLENAFELGLPAAIALYLALGLVTALCLRGVWRRHRDWVYPATGVAASVLVGVHATVDFSLQIPAVAVLYACILGIALAQATSSLNHAGGARA